MAKNVFCRGFDRHFTLSAFRFLGQCLLRFIQFEQPQVTEPSNASSKAAKRTAVQIVAALARGDFVLPE